MTLIQSFDFVYLIFNLLKYSLVITIAILVKRAVLLDIIIPAPGFMRPIVDKPTADADPTSISGIINKIFFFNDLYFFLYDSLSILSDFNIFSWSCFSDFYFKFLISSSLVFIFNNSGSFFKLGYVLIY